MTDADTPRVPDLWWSPTMGILRKNHDETDSFTAFGGGSELWLGLCLAQQWPADAVKLGDVEALRAEVEKRAELWKQQALDLNEATVKLAEIRAVLDEHLPPSGEVGRQLRALLDREPGRGATLTCPHCRTIIRATSGSITQADVDQHLADCEPARQFARECATAALGKDRARAARGHVVEHQPDTGERS